MNPELPRKPREELEARLTALLLGELSADEAAAVRRAIEQNGELAKLFARLHHTIGLVRETAAKPVEATIAPAAPLKLAEERRQKLLAQFKTVTPKQFDPSKKVSLYRLIELAAVLAIVALLAAMLLPALSKSKSKAQRITVLSNLRQLDLAKQQWAVENHKSPGDTPTFDDVKPYFAGNKLPAVADETYVLGEVGEPPSAEVEATEAKQRFGKLPSSGERTERVRLSSRGELAFVVQPTAETYALTSGVTRQAEPEIRVSPATKPALASPPVISPPAQIVLPAIEPSPTAGAARNNEVAFGNNPSLGINRGLNERAVGPATGLPVGTTDFGLAHNAGREYAKDSSDYNESSRSRSVTPLPSNSGSVVAGTPPPASVAVENLGEELKNNASPAYRSRYGITPTETAIPRVAVSGSMRDGDGGADGLGAITATNSAGAANQGAAGYYVRQGGNLNLAEGKSTWTGHVNDGSPVRFDSSSASTPSSVLVVTANDGQGGTADSPVPVLGDSPTVGHLFQNSGEGVFAAGSATEQGRRVVPESNVYSVDVVGYTDVKTKPANSAGKAIAEAGQRQPTSIELQGLTTIQPHQSQVAPQPKKPASDSQLTAGLRNKEAQLPKSEGVEQQLKDAPAELQTNWAHAEKQRELLRSSGQRVALQDNYFRLKKRESEALSRSARLEADLPLRKPATNAPIPQPEVQTSENAFSTFSLNVSDVSFKLAAASLEKGQMPDPASVRSEEFINAFDYRDPEPAAGAPIAFAWERARYPFAHNRDLLRFSLKTAAAGRQAGRPLNIVLLLDNSGSMERADRVQIIREALRVLASQLQPQDKLSVITFARTPRLVADGISGDKAGEVAEQVSGLTPEGGTNLEEAMNLAYETAARHYLANGINRVVLLTDGAANLGDVEPESLKQKVEAAAQAGHRARLLRHRLGRVQR